MKKKQIILFFMLIFLASNTSACSKKADNPINNTETDGYFEISKDLYIEKIQDGVYVIEHKFPWPANSLLIEMDDSSLVLVDTPYTPDATKQLLEWSKNTIGDREIIAINTGFHFDNLGGNRSLIDNNISVYGSDLTVSLIQERGENARSLFLQWLKGTEDKRYYKVYQDLEYVKPTNVFELQSEKKIKIGKEDIYIYYPGESHSPDNIVVYFPNKKILFGGCMIKSLDSEDLGNTEDANLKEWPNSVKKVINRFENTEIVIPGHGKWGKTNLMNHTLDLFTQK